MENGDSKSGAASTVHRLMPVWLPAAALAALLSGHAIFLATRFAPAIVTPDANGYWAQGSLLAATGKTWFEAESPAQYIGMHWLVSESGQFVSRYPPGLPVAVAFVCRLLGPEASVLVNPVLALLCLVGIYLLARLHVSFPLAFAASAVLALNPVFNQHALSCDSHMAVTFLLVWGLYFLLDWGRGGGPWRVFVAGLFLGAIPTVRYPEVLYALGVGAFLLLHWRSRPHIWMHYLVAVAGALVAILPLLIRNQLLFGAFWRTAYALTNEQTGFGWVYFKQHAGQYLQALPGEGIGLFFPLGIIGVTILCGRKRQRALGLALLLLLLPVTLLYMSYYWAPSNMTMATLRFLLPTFVVYIFAGVVALGILFERLGVGQQAAVLTVLLVVQGLWGAQANLRQTSQLRYKKQVLARTTAALKRHTERGDLIMGNKQILQHLDFVRRWKLVDPTAARRSGFRGRGMGGDGDTPQPMQMEKQRLQAKAYEGLRPYEIEDAVAQDITAWVGDHKVYMIGTQADLEELRGSAFNSRAFTIVARVALPTAPPQTSRGGPGGMGGGPPGMGGGPPDQGGPGGMGGPPDDGFGPRDRFGQGGRMGGPGGTSRSRGSSRRGAQGGRSRRRGGGCAGSFNFLDGATELVIAEWDPSASRRW